MTIFGNICCTRKMDSMLEHVWNVQRIQKIFFPRANVRSYFSFCQEKKLHIQVTAQQKKTFIHRNCGPSIGELISWGYCMLCCLLCSTSLHTFHLHVEYFIFEKRSDGKKIKIIFGDEAPLEGTYAHHNHIRRELLWY